jgi:hydrogenase-4 component E
VSDWIVWALVGLGIAAVVARRRSVAAALVGAQTLAVGVAALALVPGRSAGFAAAAIALVVKALVVSVILWLAVTRTRGGRPMRDEAAPLARLGGTVAGVLAVVGLLPTVGLETRSAEQAAIALVAVGVALVLLRRATIFQVLGLLVAENGLAVAAVAVSGGLPLVIELGVAFDLVVVVAVAAAFHERIFGVFGTTDTAALRGLRE